MDFKDGSHMIISTDVEKTFEKNPEFLHDKSPRKNARKNLYQQNRGSIWQTHSQHHAREKSEAIPLKSGIR